MTVELAHIVRHPIKAIGVEELAEATIEAGRALPHDRVWAVAHEGAKFAGQPDSWQSKMNFLRGVAGPELMAIRARLDEGTGTVELTHPRAGMIRVRPDADEAALLAWLAPLWPESRPAPRGVVRVPGQAMTDWPDPFLALIGTASNEALGRRLGRPLSIHRWRANLWVSGWEPFAEFDLIGRRVQIGNAVLEIRQRITRCKATTVNPETGITDADTLGALEAGWGHEDFGVYATVAEAGKISVGDTVVVL